METNIKILGMSVAGAFIGAQIMKYSGNPKLMGPGALVGGVIFAIVSINHFKLKK